MTHQQRVELLAQMKVYVQQHPAPAKQLLQQNPQLAHILLHIQLLFGMVKPHNIEALQQPIMPPLPAQPVAAYPPAGFGAGPGPVPVPYAHPAHVIPANPYASAPINQPPYAAPAYNQPAPATYSNRPPVPAPLQQQLQQLPPEQQALLQQVMALTPEQFAALPEAVQHQVRQLQMQFGRVQ